MPIYAYKKPDDNGNSVKLLTVLAGGEQHADYLVSEKDGEWERVEGFDTLNQLKRETEDHPSGVYETEL